MLCKWLCSLDLTTCVFMWVYVSFFLLCSSMCRTITWLNMLKVNTTAPLSSLCISSFSQLRCSRPLRTNTICNENSSALTQKNWKTDFQTYERCGEICPSQLKKKCKSVLHTSPDTNTFLQHLFTALLPSQHRSHRGATQKRNKSVKEWENKWRNIKRNKYIKIGKWKIGKYTVLLFPLAFAIPYCFCCFLLI